MCNKDIREYAVKNNVRLWQIASVLQINDGNFSRKLRVELSQEEKQRIKDIIDKLASEQQGVQVMDNVLTVQQVAVALKKDAQTIRYLLDNKLVPYGMSYRRRGSKRKS